MANALATSSIVAKEFLAVLKNNMVFSQYCNRKYQSEFGSNMARGYEPGATISIKKPPRYEYRAGLTSSPQATTISTIPLTLSAGGADISFTGMEKTLSVKDLSVEIEAAANTVINQIDKQGLALAHYAAFNTLNPSGTAPNTQALAVDAMTSLGRRLNEMGADTKNRAVISGPALNAYLTAGTSGMFNSQSTIGKQNSTGLFLPSYGFDADMSQNVDTHTNGAATATNINGANQTGSTITVLAIAGGTLTRGTVITLPGVFAVNPVSRQSTGVLADFVVTADALVGATSISISPAITVTGPFQNVTASPTTAQPYVIKGAASTAYQTNVAFHRDAFTLAMVPLWRPTDGLGVKVKDLAAESYDGYSVTVMEYFDPVNYVSAMRLDVLFAWAATYPELAVKYYTT